jgi:hypothetical protein
MQQYHDVENSDNINFWNKYTLTTKHHSQIQNYINKAKVILIKGLISFGYCEVTDMDPKAQLQRLNPK